MSAAALGRGAAWILVLLCLVPWQGGNAPARGSDSLARRLLGPIAGLAASVQWVRFDVALRDGRHEHAYALAEVALTLDPGSPSGWYALARHLVFERASREVESDPAARRRWIRAGLATLERGEAVTRDPGELAFLRASLLAQFVAQIPDEELAWPGGPAAALEAAILAFELAATRGHPRGAEYAGYARADLAGIPR